VSEPGDRRRPLLVAALVLAVAVTGFVLVAGGLRTAGERVAAPTPTSDPATPPAISPSPTAAADSDPDEELPRHVEIARHVETIRGLEFTTLPEPVFLSQDAIADRIEEMLEDYTEEEADADRRILALLGAVPADADLRALLRTALGEQVAGFYDKETGELVVASDDEELGAFAEVALAHELAHALVDQVIGLPRLDDVEAGAEDAALAAQALVEGDATLVMLRYVQGVMSREAQAELLREQMEAGLDPGALDALPHYLRASLIFPYEEGLAFVARLHGAGGWSRVDEALRKLPRTTLEIMRPELYLDGAAPLREVEVTESLPEPWTQESRRSFGAADLFFLFQAPGDDAARALGDARQRAMLWRGGTLMHWTDGPSSAIVVALVGEDGLCTAVAGWYRRAFPDARETRNGAHTFFSRSDQEARLECSGDDVRLAIAPDRETIRHLSADAG
jgi:hypothetical protein